jgi:polysaccharide pyruvyl transferase WcaK-like protein/O-antigen/teichoic acid export membrane protein
VLDNPAAAAPARRFRGVARRLGWGVADQAVSSLTNFAMTLYVARVLGAVPFGAFSLAYVTYSFALNASRGLATDPLMVRFSGPRTTAWQQAVASSSATALAVGVASGAVVLATTVALTGTTRAAFLALGLVLPGLLLQDSWRYAFFAVGQGGLAFLNDCTWALTMVLGLVYLRTSGHASVSAFIGVWGAGAAVAAAVGPLQARVLPCLSGIPRWLSHTRDLGLRYLAENTCNSGASQLRSYGVGILVGLAAVGYVQAVTTLMGPFLVVFMGLSLVTIPEANRVLRRSPQRLPMFCLAVGTGLAVAALAWGAFLLVTLPRGVGGLLLGGLWRPTYELVLPMTASVMGACLIAGATAGLHALGAARRSLRAMIWSAAVYLASGLVGAAVGGALGAICGAAVATWVGSVAWWWQLRAALREAAIISAAPPARSSRRLGRRQREKGAQYVRAANTTVQKVGLFGLLGSGNTGNDVSMEAVLDYLRREHPNAVVDAMCGGPEVVAARYGIPAIPVLWYAGHGHDETGVVAVGLKALGKAIDAVRTAAWVRRHDVVIVPGAGALEATLPVKPFGFPYAMFLLCASGRVFRTKVALVSVGANVISQPVTRWFLDSAARLAYYRSYRDDLSKDAMRRRGLAAAQDRVYPDLAFAAPLPPAGAGDTGTVGVGVMAYYGGNDERRSAVDIHASYVTTMKAFTLWLVDTGHKVRLFSGDDRYDNSVADEILAHLHANRPDLDADSIAVASAASFADVAREMAAVGTVVATRYHNVVCALKLGKPTLALGYSDKFRTLMASMGLSEFCESASQLDLGRLIRLFTELESRAGLVRQAIAGRNLAIAELIDGQFGALSAALFGAANPALSPSNPAAGRSGGSAENAAR